MLADMHRRSFRMLMTAGAMVVLTLAGCADEDSSTSTTATAGSPVRPETQTQAALPAPQTEVQSTVEEEPAPYGVGTMSDQAVGMLVDGLSLNDIRWSDHEDYFRVVFELGTSEGEPLLQVPHAESSLSPDGKTLTLKISGVRSIGPEPNVNTSELGINDDLVTSITRIPSMDDQLMVYEIQLSQAANYSLAGLGSPGRIVVDINKG